MTLPGGKKSIVVESLSIAFISLEKQIELLS